MMFTKNRFFLFLFFLIIFISFMTIPCAFSQSHLGDTNGDNVTDIVDALLVAQYYVGLNPENFNRETADVDGTGTIDIVDALLIAQFYVGLISEFPGQGEIIIIGSELARNMDPQLENGELKSVVDGNNLFAFDCFHGLKGDDGNLFFSPVSISYAFGMCVAGANGNTASQIADTMHFNLQEERLHNAFNGLEIALTSEQDEPPGVMGDNLKLHIANSTWGQQGYYFVPDYLDILATHYGAAMNTVDFISEPEPCRLLINSWVSEETENRINDLIPEGAISPVTRLVLTNAIYFKANWFDPFNAADTQAGLFNRLDGTIVPAQMMFQITTSPFYEVPGEYKAVKLRYQGEKNNSMIIILPENGFYTDFENNFSLNQLTEMKEAMIPHNVHLTLPQFSFGWANSLKNLLQDLGMTDAFNSSLADFSGINGERNLFIGDVFHQSFVAVDEKGTEASAATAIVFPESSMPDEATMTIDHPFIFLIVNDDTGAILFLGRVLSL
ncbi:MAG: hypothetical protein JXJ04_06000 [Spirochaetales bacterium]|nr:hypothetical protein [Spirochaetales bacterium]